MISVRSGFPKHFFNDLDHEVKYLHPTDEREASEESHGSSYGGHLVHKLGCSVLDRSYGMNDRKGE